MVGVLKDGQPVSIILQVQLVVLHVRTDLQHLQELPPKKIATNVSLLLNVPYRPARLDLHESGTIG